jgi:geranylgeranyl pyrophosphate synthase
MIHTASLLHDDVIDEADTRRGKPSVNAKYGNKLAILGGVFPFCHVLNSNLNLSDMQCISFFYLELQFLPIR